MSNYFDITSQTKSMTLIAGAVASIELTVTNTSGRPVTAILSLSSREHGQVEWLKFIAPAQQHFENNESHVIHISMHTQALAELGDSTIKFLIAAEHNPDEAFAVYDFPLSIIAPAEKPKPRWPWILAAVAAAVVLLSLCIWIFSGRGSAQVPSVIGLRYTQAADKLRAAGFKPVLAATDLSELRSDAFMDLSPALIKRVQLQRQLQRQATTDTTDATKNNQDTTATESEQKKPEIISDDQNINLDQAIIPQPVTDSNDLYATAEQNDQENAPTTPLDGTTAELLEQRLVWHQATTGLAKIGSAIPLKVVPQLISIAAPSTFTPRALKTYFEQQNVFFDSIEAIPPGYRYGAGLENAPQFSPSLDALFEGSRVTAHILPSTLTVPDFTKMSLSEISTQPEFRFQFLYYYAKGNKRSTNKLSTVLDWANVQKEQGRFVYIYHQTPSAQSNVARDHHIITLEIDSRPSGLTQK